VHCDRDEKKSRRCRGQPSRAQLSQLAQDAHRLLGLASEELLTAAATEHATAVAPRAAGMRHAGTHRKKQGPWRHTEKTGTYPQQQRRYDEHSSEINDGALELSEDAEGNDDDRSQDLDYLAAEPDSAAFTNEDDKDETEDNFGSADAEGQLAEGVGDQLDATRRNVMLGMEHNTGEVTKYDSFGEDMKRSSGKLHLHNSSETTTNNSETGLGITTTPDRADDLEVQEHGVTTFPDRANLESGLGASTIPDINTLEEEDLPLDALEDLEGISTTTSLTTNRQLLEDLTPVDGLDNIDSRHFNDLQSRQTDLEKAHEQLQQVATQANELAMKTYKDINAYQQSVEDLHDPVHEVARQAHELHSKFADNIRSGEVERLQAWEDLAEALKKAGVDD